MHKTKKQKAIIIGSGFGGLSLAIRLLSLGFEVEIHEKNKMVGGHAYQFKSKGYTFDMGPSIITIPFIIKDLFKLFNKNLENYIKLYKLDPFYRAYFHDKSFIDYSGSSSKMKDQLAKFNKKDAKNYDKFIKYSSKIYDDVINNGVGNTPIENWKDFFAVLPKLINKKGILPCYFTVTRYFKDFRSRFMFSFHPMFIGANPFKAPSIYLMIPYLEKYGGVWFSKGGMYALVQAMEKLIIEQGGKIYKNSDVQEIIIKNKSAIGIKTKEKTYNSDLVISNVHTAYTYLNLIKDDNRKKWTNKKVKKLDYGMSCVVIYIGVKKQYQKLKHHTLILSKRYKGLIKDIFDNKVLADDFSIYLHAPSKTDSSMAPKGCESLYMLIPVPNLKADINWDKHKDTFTQKILDFLQDDFGLTDLKQNIEVQKTYTPKDFEVQRNNYLGACWSIEPKISQIGMFKPTNKAKDYNNLYFVGASVHPGPGVPGVILSAQATAKLIKRDFNIHD